MLGGCIIGCAGNSTCYIECDKVFQDQLKVTISSFRIFTSMTTGMSLQRKLCNWVGAHATTMFAPMMKFQDPLSWFCPIPMSQIARSPFWLILTAKSITTWFSLMNRNRGWYHNLSQRTKYSKYSAEIYDNLKVGHFSWRCLFVEIPWPILGLWWKGR